MSEDDWDKLKLAVRLTELSYNFYNYSKEYFDKTKVIVYNFSFDFVYEVRLDSNLYLGCTPTATMQSLNEVSVVTKFKLISDHFEQLNVNVSEQTLDTTNLPDKGVARLLVQEIEKQIAYGKDKAMLFKN